MPINNSHRAISFFRYHIFERTLVYYMKIGAAGYYAESIEKVGDNLKEIKPVLYNCAPYREDL